MKMTYLKSFSIGPLIYGILPCFFSSKKARGVTGLCYTRWRDLRLSSYDSTRCPLLTLSLPGVRNLKKITSNNFIKNKHEKEAIGSDSTNVERKSVCIVVQL